MRSGAIGRAMKHLRMVGVVFFLGLSCRGAGDGDRPGRPTATLSVQHRIAGTLRSLRQGRR